MDDPRERLKSLVSPDLAEVLGELFPDRCPDPSLTDRQVWLAAGAVSVVRLINSLLDEIRDENLNSRTS